MLWANDDSGHMSAARIDILASQVQANQVIAQHRMQHPTYLDIDCLKDKAHVPADERGQINSTSGGRNPYASRPETGDSTTQKK
jgi:hypothetical protein